MPESRASQTEPTTPELERFLWLSLGAAVVILGIKLAAAVLTGSIGLWSDALESTVNVAAAGVALWALRLSAKPADHNHDFGHGKAEYFSAAVEGSMILVAVTNLHWLDPVIALVVGANILFTGYKLVRRSVVGLLDGTLPPDEVEKVSQVLDEVAHDARVHIAQLRTRESGRQRFVYATVTVPGEWTVTHSHDLADAVEAAVDAALPGTTTFVHIEPNDDRHTPA